jgi:hypothetical protein
MGIQDEIARQEQEAREQAAAASARKQETSGLCAEFLQMVRQANIPPSGHYFRYTKGEKKGLVYRRLEQRFDYLGAFWTVYSDYDTYTYAVSERGEPVCLDTQYVYRRVAYPERKPRIVFDDRTRQVLGCDPSEDRVAVLANGSSSLGFTEQHFAEAFRNLRQR